MLSVYICASGFRHEEDQPSWPPPWEVIGKLSLQQHQLLGQAKWMMKVGLVRENER